MTNTVFYDGRAFAAWVVGGASRLYAERKEINDLNVFPIPDGDTGDNMYMTVKAGAAAAVCDGIGDTAAAVAEKMLYGARGNSGVILSRIFAGIAAGLRGRKDADTRAIADAFSGGVKESYRAVSHPQEGTILTVFREAVAYANARLGDASDIESYLGDFLTEAGRSLERTPDLLPVLKEAGVIDSGGAGLIAIVGGMLAAARGEAPSDVPEETNAAVGAPDLSLFTEDSVLEYGYCTEFLLRLQRAKTDLDRFDTEAFRAHLCEIGESVVAFRDESVVKVHIHTKTPSEVLAFAQQYGEFLTVKIENMTLQHHEAAEAKKDAPSRHPEYRKEPRKKFAAVAVAAGNGIKETFRSIGADAVIDGGVSMNPSAEDFIRAFGEVSAETIFVFPGDGNILLAASQAAALYGDAAVRVIPTKTVGETYVALSSLDYSSDDADAIVSEVTESFAAVVTGCVSRASRDSSMSGVAVQCGDYIGYGDKTVYIADRDRENALMGLAERLDAGKYDVLLLLCGSDTNPDDARRVYDRLTALYRHTEVIMLDGGQPICDYILTLI